MISDQGSKAGLWQRYPFIRMAMSTNLRAKIVFNAFVFVSRVVNAGVNDFKFKPCDKLNGSNRTASLIYSAFVKGTSTGI